MRYLLNELRFRFFMWRNRGLWIKEKARCSLKR